ncbi:hypothetical protein Bbelb_026830 [Branchiostoma belcheri]|nr:hypothetical protein Bbelb_026830 [Branchiostoma belcheri]
MSTFGTWYQFSDLSSIKVLSRWNCTSCWPGSGEISPGHENRHTAKSRGTPREHRANKLRKTPRTPRVPNLTAIYHVPITQLVRLSHTEPINSQPITTAAQSKPQTVWGRFCTSDG